MLKGFFDLGRGNTCLIPKCAIALCQFVVSLIKQFLDITLIDRDFTKQCLNRYNQDLVNEVFCLCGVSWLFVQTIVENDYSR